MAKLKKISKWKDVSSYSKNDDVRTPKTFEFLFGVMRLIVTRHIYYRPGAWVASCEGVFVQREMKSESLDDAQREALCLARSVLETALAELPITRQQIDDTYREYSK